MTWDKNLVALRSLRSEHHANHIEPNVILVNWNLGKRCNYDCSYCSPALHDWNSPHYSLEDIKNAVDQIDSWATGRGKTFNMSLTGGEPFIHPKILDILKIIKESKSFGDQLSVITNGSLPLELFEQSLEYITHLTISLHLERSESDIEKILNKCITLHQKFPDRWINVQVMCLPGKFDFIEQTIIPTFESNNIKFVLRRIRPWLNEANDEWKNTSKRQILKTNYDLNSQTIMKEAEKKFLDSNLADVYDSESYYTKQELGWLSDRVPATTWQNVGIWNTDLEYTETNSDLMVSNNQNRFNNWHCFIGIDSLFIDFDGLIYRGVCHNEGSIGQLGGNINFVGAPTVCQKLWCTSNVDQTIRKSRKDFLHLITT